MSFQVSERAGQAGGQAETIIELHDAAGTVRAEVWPRFGFNCLRWQLRRADGSWGNLLYCDPNWPENPVPTRSGHPILFPFPNRLKVGRFEHRGQQFQLPLNETTGTHAIHGFTPRNPWRVVEQGSDDSAAWVTGEFRLDIDAPAARNFWPVNFVIRVTYRLEALRLLVSVAISNESGQQTLPWGLGFHPYFACPHAPDATADEMVLFSAAAKLWQTESAIPTGQLVPVPAELDFRQPRPIERTHFDTLLGDLGANSDENGLTIATLGHIQQPGVLEVKAPALFRELVLFIPPHRRAVAIEPYTCATDAPNLTARGIDAGWQTLAPHKVEQTWVEYRWHPDRTGSLFASSAP